MDDFKRETSRSAEKDFVRTFEMRLLKLREESIIIPRSLTDEDRGIEQPPKTMWEMSHC
jgi:DUF438 domain-containing protein